MFFVSLAAFARATRAVSPLVQRPPLVDHTELTRFHSDDYINFIRGISPDNMQDHLRELQRCESALVSG